MNEKNERGKSFNSANDCDFGSVDDDYGRLRKTQNCSNRQTNFAMRDKEENAFRLEDVQNEKQLHNKKKLSRKKGKNMKKI